MKNARALLLLILMSVLILSIVGCSEKGVSDDTSEANPTTAEVSETDSTINIEENPLTSLEIAQRMGNGINLGNTMEAFGRLEVGLEADISDYETIWGQPITTQEMVTGMKNAGFDSLRIPVAWTNTMNYENGDYTIREDYIDRVEEIVNYALNANMTVVINDHWDGGWWGMFGSETQETRDKGMALYTSMWTQIAERFKDYPYEVIFESANEELGSRFNDRDVAKDSGALSEDDCYAMTNTINQAFVDLIRSTGGNNTQRFLLIAGYNTDIEKTVDDRFKMPTDSAASKLLLSVHYYTPWSYCGTTGMATWGTESHINTMNTLLGSLTKFTDQGVGVIIGEYAVLTKSDGSLKNNTVDFTANFLDNCDLYGYVPMLWDTNAFYKRDALKITDEALAELFEVRKLESEAGLTIDQIKDNAKTSMASRLAAAIENDKTATGPVITGSEDAIAWIMFNSLDYSVTYSVGDVYDPTLKTEGVVATDVKIEKAGTYTIGLDFTGTANGYAESTVFAAIGISNGELLFPNHVINIQEVLINGTPYTLKGIPYTTADDEICTRLNLYNGWVTKVDASKARFTNPNMANFLSAMVIDPKDLDKVETLSITFEYSPSK